MNIQGGSQIFYKYAYRKQPEINKHSGNNQTFTIMLTESNQKYTYILTESN